MTTGMIALVAHAPDDEPSRLACRGAAVSRRRAGPSTGILCRRLTEQRLARHEKVGQRTGHDEAMPVLPQAPVADLGEAEDALDHADGMLDLGTHPRFAAIPGPLRSQSRRLAWCEVPRVRCAHAQDGGLPSIGGISPYPPFTAVQQEGHHVTVVDMGWRGLNGVNELVLAVHAEMALHAEVPLLALPGLLHLRIARTSGVLCRRRRGDDCRVDDGPGADRQPPRLQMPVHLLEERLAQAVLFHQMPKL